MSDKKAFHVYMPAVNDDIWTDMSARYGVSKSALFNVLTPRLEELLDDDLVAEARRLDASRRGRRRRARG